jgi:hypothetical protein
MSRRGGPRRQSAPDNPRPPSRPGERQREGVGLGANTCHPDQIRNPHVGAVPARREDNGHDHGRWNRDQDSRKSNEGSPAEHRSAESTRPQAPPPDPDAEGRGLVDCPKLGVSVEEVLAQAPKLSQAETFDLRRRLCPDLMLGHWESPGVIEEA